MESTVYFVPISDWTNPATVEERFGALLARLPWEAASDQALAAIKLTFGEAGNAGHPPAHVIAALVRHLKARGCRPFLTETNTLYHGRRMNAVDHLEVAREHGFTHESVGAPIILSDGLAGREDHAVPLGGKRVEEAHLAPVVRDLNFLVAVAHLTGHMVEGVGGAVKNLGMGLASRAGKLDQHSAVSPFVSEEKCVRCYLCGSVCPVEAITLSPTTALIDRATCIGCADCIAVCPTGAIRIDWSRESAHVQEATAEYALGVVRAIEGRGLYINLLNHITKQCDCMGPTKEQLVGDIGILAGNDPVACDQASIDLVNQEAGVDLFRRTWPEIDYEIQLRHGEAIGLGTRTYRLETI